MHVWDELYTYFVEQGLPGELLNFACLRSEEAQRIAECMIEMRPRAILEIGAFVGLSTGVLALSSGPECVIVSVDPNYPVSLISQRLHYREERCALTFLIGMLRHFDLTAKVHILEGIFSAASSAYLDRFVAAGGSVEAMSGLAPIVVGEKARMLAPYDLVFLDGDHSANVVYQDLSLIQAYLAQEGVIIMHDVDDCNYWAPGIQSAVMRFRNDFPLFRFDREGSLGFLRRRSAEKNEHGSIDDY